VDVPVVGDVGRGDMCPPRAVAALRAELVEDVDRAIGEDSSRRGLEYTAFGGDVKLWGLVGELRVSACMLRVDRRGSVFCGRVSHDPVYTSGLRAGQGGVRPASACPDAAAGGKTVAVGAKEGLVGWYGGGAGAGAQAGGSHAGEAGDVVAGLARADGLAIGALRGGEGAVQQRAQQGKNAARTEGGKGSCHGCLDVLDRALCNCEVVTGGGKPTDDV